MSASNELEPGPSGFGSQVGQNWVRQLGIRLMSREVQATARAVGWGGFTGG